jgi:hypothetical protein
MKALPTNKEAVLTLIEETMRDKYTKRSFSKVYVALTCLGLNNLEVIEVMHHMDLCKADGEPYPYFVKTKE